MQEKLAGQEITFKNYKLSTVIFKNGTHSKHDTEDVLESVCSRVYLQLKNTGESACLRCSNDDCIVNFTTKI